MEHYLDKYTDEDIKLIQYAVSKGIKIKVLATQLGRTEKGLYRKIGIMKRKGLLPDKQKELTEQEEQIKKLLFQGYSKQAICHKFNICLNTLENKLRRICRKKFTKSMMSLLVYEYIQLKRENKLLRMQLEG